MMKWAAWCGASCLLLAMMSIWQASVVPDWPHSLPERSHHDDLTSGVTDALNMRTSAPRRAPRSKLVSPRQYVDKCLTPVHILHWMDRLLRDVTSALDALGVGYWLDHGTLLGALRFGSFLPFDDDVDLGILDMDFTPLVERRFAVAMRTKGYRIMGRHNPPPGRKKRKNFGTLVQIYINHSHWSSTSAGAASSGPDEDGDGGDARNVTMPFVLRELHLDLWVYEFGNPFKFDRKSKGVPRVQFATYWHHDYMKTSSKYRLHEGIPIELLFGPFSSALVQQNTTTTTTTTAPASRKQTTLALRMLTAEPITKATIRSGNVSPPESLVMMRSLMLNGQRYNIPYSPWQWVRIVVSSNAMLTSFYMDKHHSGDDDEFACPATHALTSDIIRSDNESLWRMLTHLDAAFGGGSVPYDGAARSELLPEMPGSQKQLKSVSSDRGALRFSLQDSPLYHASRAVANERIFLWTRTSRRNWTDWSPRAKEVLTRFGETLVREADYVDVRPQRLLSSCRRDAKPRRADSRLKKLTILVQRVLRNVGVIAWVSSRRFLTRYALLANASADDSSPSSNDRRGSALPLWQSDMIFRDSVAEVSMSVLLDHRSKQQHVHADGSWNYSGAQRLLEASHAALIPCNNSVKAATSPLMVRLCRRKELSPKDVESLVVHWREDEGDQKKITSAGLFPHVRLSVVSIHDASTSVRCIAPVTAEKNRRLLLSRRNNNSSVTSSCRSHFSSSAIPVAAVFANGFAAYKNLLQINVGRGSDDDDDDAIVMPADVMAYLMMHQPSGGAAEPLEFVLNGTACPAAPRVLVVYP